MSFLSKTIDSIRDGVDDLVEAIESVAGEWVTGLLRRRKIRKTLPDAVSESEHKRAARTLETGREYYNKKRHKKAAKYFRRAISIDGRYGLAHYYYGNALYKLSEVKGARAAWQRAIDVEPSSSAADKAREKLGNKTLGSDREVRIVEPGEQ